MSKTLDKLSNGGAGLPCCGLASLAIVTGTPLPIIYLHYAAKFNKPKQWRGATGLLQTQKMLKLYLVKFEEQIGIGRNLENFIKDNPHTFAMVRTTGHIQTIMGSVVRDQNGTKPIEDYWGRKMRVSHVLRIKEQEITEPYRHLLLVQAGVCKTMEEAKQLYERYRNER